MDPLVSWQEQQKGNFLFLLLHLLLLFFAILTPIGSHLSSYINVAYRSTFLINLSSDREKERGTRKMILSKSSFFLLLNNNNNIQTKKKKKKKSRKRAREREREREKIIVGTTTNITAERKRERVSFVYTLTVRHLIHQVDRKREKEIGLIIIAECVCCCCNAIKNSILFPSNMMSINRRNWRRYTYI